MGKHWITVVKFQENKLKFELTNLEYSRGGEAQPRR